MVWELGHGGGVALSSINPSFPIIPDPILLSLLRNRAGSTGPYLRTGMEFTNLYEKNYPTLNALVQFKL